MYYYFCSHETCAIKVNGEYIGKLNSEPKQIDIDNKECLLEVCPLDSIGPNVNFILTNETLYNPPQNMYVTDLRGGYLIKFNNFTKKPMQVIKQKEYKNIKVTIFYEGSLKISIESQKDFLIEELTINITTAEISFFNMNGGNFIAIFFKEENYLIIYNIDNKISKVFSEPCIDFSYGGVLKIAQNYNDILKHNTTYSYIYKNNSFILQDTEVHSKNSYSKDRYCDGLIPFLFFEELLVGGDISTFCTPTILENKDKLKGYLGNYITVITPPTFININYIGLVYKKKDNLFYVDYYKVELENGLINNILKV